MSLLDGIINIADALKKVDGQEVIMRLDLNASEGSSRRLEAALPTLKLVHETAKKIVIVTHLSREKDEINRSNAYIAEALSDMLSVDVKSSLYLQDASGPDKGIHLLQNIRKRRFGGELDSVGTDRRLGIEKHLKLLGAVYVNDAFGVLHRDHASVSLGKMYEDGSKFVGPLVKNELETLSPYLTPERLGKTTLVMGGSKVSDKAPVIKNLIESGCREICIGGGMVATFLKAQGFNVGASAFQDRALVKTATEIIKLAEQKGVRLIIPTDVIVAKNISGDGARKVNLANSESIGSDEMIFDIGSDSAKHIAETITMCDDRHVVVNGAMGVFENKNFQEGTAIVWEAVASKPEGTAIMAGGDSGKAFDVLNIDQNKAYVSTGGGATLAVLAGKKLPGLEGLRA